MKNIGLSLLVPCYNAESHIPHFLENLKKLNLGFDEIIFYDDASVDNTFQLLTDYNYRVIQDKVNRGPGYARNQLAKSATQEYIHFHDIDDKMHSNFVLIVKSHLLHNCSEVVIGQCDWIDSKTRNELLKWRYDQKLLSDNPLRYLITNPVGGINSVYSKAAFDKIKGYDEDIRCWEDADLHVRLAASGAKIHVIDEVLSISLRNDNSISNDQVWCWSCRLIFLQRYLDSYLHIVGIDVFSKELKKMQVYFTKEGQFQHLSTIANLSKKFDLKIEDSMSVFIRLVSYVVPKALLQNLINLVLSIKRKLGFVS